MFPCASQAEKVHRISPLVAEDQFVSAFEGFKKQMSELGYIGGKNIRYDFFNAKGDVDTLKKLAQKIVQEKPDLIVTSSTTATFPVAKLAEGSDLPVVFLSAGNPLKLVKSYRNSGNNLTGISSSVLELTEKRLELFRELVPAGRHVISIINSRATNYEEYMASTREATKRTGLMLSEIEIQAINAAEVRKQIPLITHKLGDGLLIPPDAAFVGATESIVQQSIKERLPALDPNIQIVRRGLLAAYSLDDYSLGQHGTKDEVIE